MYFVILKVLEWSCSAWPGKVNFILWLNFLTLEAQIKIKWSQATCSTCSFVKMPRCINCSLFSQWLKNNSAQEDPKNCASTVSWSVYNYFQLPTEAVVFPHLFNEVSGRVPVDCENHQNVDIKDKTNLLRTSLAA